MERGVCSAISAVWSAFLVWSELMTVIPSEAGANATASRRTPRSLPPVQTWMIHLARTFAPNFFGSTRGEEIHRS